MDIKKWVPWNWFKKEENNAGKTIPVQRENSPIKGYAVGHPLQQFHQEIDRLFDHAFRDFGSMPFGYDHPMIPRMADGMLKPTLDIGTTDKEYTISIEVPGVNEADIKLEIVNDTLTIRGEKQHEKEEKEKNYYRMERSYGSFQRVLSLPEDADQENVTESFKKGVLKVNMPRRAISTENVRRIAIEAV